jgi:glycosyltransferase involved in cell wall biosynthesis
MKILFDEIRGHSGVTIWTERLCTHLNHTGISAEIRRHPFSSQFIPLSRFSSQIMSENTLQHTNSWCGCAFRTNIPQVVTVHSSVHQPELNRYKTPGQRAYHALIKHYESRSVTGADKVICVSRYTRDLLEKTFGYSDSHVIYNGVDTQVFRPESFPDNSLKFCSDKIRILFVGNLTRLKGADLLPGIMDLLDDRFILMTVHGFRQKMTTLHKRIVCIGTLPESDLMRAYNACDIFLTPSRLEGLSLSTAEAMACGKPVVATNGSSMPEMVIDGRGGFLCTMDVEKNFADNIRYLAEDPELARKMGNFNRQRILDNFTLERMTQEYTKIYHSLAG